MQLPHVVIIGRPNVGKSSLFNCLVGERVAIVDATPGVTRDRIARTVAHQGRVFELVDTGGIGIVDSDDLSDEVERQIAMAMEEADLVLLVMDARAGVETLDEEVAARVRALDKPTLLVANKVESQTLEAAADNLRRLGFGPPRVISSNEGFGKSDLLDAVVESLGEKAPLRDEHEAKLVKVALVGKRNAGKSTLLNRLAGSERVTVSNIPGTTRDSVDVEVDVEGKRLVIIDTAGVRRKKSIQNSLDFYSTHRTEESIRRCDVVLLMIDASQELSRVDKKLAAYIQDEHKPVLIVLNKWDLAEQSEVEHFQDYVDRFLPGLAFAPIAAMSALTGHNVEEVFRLAAELHVQSGTRVTTGELNRVVQEAVNRRSPEGSRTKKLNVKYATQVGTHPPHVVVFCNDRSLVRADYTRYLAGQLRDNLPFGEVPIRIHFRSSGRRSRPRPEGLKAGGGRSGGRAGAGRPDGGKKGRPGPPGGRLRGGETKGRPRKK